MSACNNPRPQPLETVRLVLPRCAPELLPLDHVVDLVSAFLDSSDRIKLARAVTSKYHRLVLRVADRIDHNVLLDSALRLHWFMHAMEAAIRGNDIEIARVLLAREPRAMRMRCLAIAVEHATLELVEWVATQTCHRGCDGCLNGQSLPTRTGTERVRVLQWLKEQGHLTRVTEAWAETAVSEGDVATLQWLLESHTFAPTICAQLTQDAGELGHLDVVKYLRGQGYEATDYELMLARAIMRREDEVAEYFTSEGTRQPRTSVLLKAALRENRVDLLDELDRESSYLSDRATMEAEMSAAFERGDLAVVKWLFGTKSCRVRYRTLSTRLSDSHVIEMAQWACSHIVDIFRSIVGVLAERGLLEMIKKTYSANTHEDGWPYTTDEEMDRAAANGHLDVLQWLYELHHNPIKPSVMISAARGGHLHVIQWLHDKCPPDWPEDRYNIHGRPSEVMNAAAAAGHLEVVIWLHENRIDGCTASAMDSARRLDIVQWLYENRTEGCTSDAHVAAAEEGDLRLLQFLAEKYPSLDITRAVDAAIRRGHTVVVAWLLARSQGPQ